ncbi:MAG: hypothetical protein P4L50_08550 [Anaerolineaceae bacterium]|nr:hypothetical protein [Anaerolineaceae bacterium]
MKKAVFAALVLALFAVSASAQSYLGGSTTVGLKATVAESMSFSVTNPVINFNIFDPTKTTNGDNTVSFTASYFMKNGANFAVCVASNFFGTTGLVGTGTNTDVIPMAAIEVQPMATGSYISLSGAEDACGLPNGVTILAKQPITGNKGSATGSFNLAIAPVTVRPDVYNGTVLLYFQEL